MKNLTIIFSKANTPLPIFSWLIMWAEGTPYSHVSVEMLDAETGNEMIYQASHTFVNSMTYPEFITQETVIECFNFSVDDSIQIACKKYAESKLGISYGVLGILGLAIVQIASWIGKKMNNPFPDAGKPWCSEMIAAMLENTDCLQTDEPLDDITPKDLFPLIQSLPKVWHKKAS